MKLTPDHPWAVDVCGHLCMTCGAADRLSAVKASTDIAWLEKVKSPRVTDHLTVRIAARRRIKALQKLAAEKQSLVGKFCRLPWAGAWTKILEHKGNHIRVRSHRGKPAIWFAITPDTEVRDKAGVEAAK